MHQAKSLPLVCVYLDCCTWIRTRTMPASGIAATGHIYHHGANVGPPFCYYLKSVSVSYEQATDGVARFQAAGAVVVDSHVIGFRLGRMQTGLTLRI
jgi:hypothetical protein